MADFLLCTEVNAGIGRRLRDRGHAVTRARDIQFQRASEQELLRHAGADGLIVVTHDERRFAREFDPGMVPPHAGVLIVPQAPHEDILRIGDAIHKLIDSDRPEPNTLYRFGLLSGWARLMED